MKWLYYSCIVWVLWGCKSDQVSQSPSALDEPLTYLALGDSYTIGESVAQELRWPNQLADSLHNRGIEFQRPLIIARTGWRSDQLQTAIDTLNQKDYDLVTLLIGVNDFYQNWPAPAFEPKFTALLDSAILLAGGNKQRVLVVSIPDYGFTPFGQANQAQITAGLTEYNNLIEQQTTTKGVTYIYITDISQRGLIEPDLVASDGLHPSGKQYSLWVQRLLNSGFFHQYR
jgi:lysophospholipase L1-like esterase